MDNHCKCLLVTVDELWLKGKNKTQFISRLKKQVRRTAESFTESSIKLAAEGARLIVECDTGFSETATDRVARLAGISSVALVRSLPSDLELVKKAALEWVLSLSELPKTFRVTARRSYKEFPIKSDDIARQVGGYIYEYFDGKIKVQMKDSDLDIKIFVQKGRIFLSCAQIKGVGGLPVGSNGKMLTLLSGGIDSPVASFLMAKRGIEQGLVFFYARPYVGEEVLEKIVDLAKALKAYLNHGPLYVVPFGDIQQYIAKHCNQAYRTLFFRIYMLKTANVLAGKVGASGVITGDALGQVSSQTLNNLLAVTKCVPEAMVFRPLIGLNKNEIIDYAQKIGTYQTSIIPHDDACSMLAPKRPVTQANLDYCHSFLKEHPIEEMIEAALLETQQYIFNRRGNFRTKPVREAIELLVD